MVTNIAVKWMILGFKGAQKGVTAGTLSLYTGMTKLERYLVSQSGIIIA